jgi:hypothetical protein
MGFFNNIGRADDGLPGFFGKLIGVCWLHRRLFLPTAAPVRSTALYLL